MLRLLLYALRRRITVRREKLQRDFSIRDFNRESPGGPHFHCRGPRFHPWWGTKIPQAAWGGQKNKKRERERDFNIKVRAVLK